MILQEKNSAIKLGRKSGFKRKHSGPKSISRKMPSIAGGSHLIVLFVFAAKVVFK
jgi:hypothetical protein